MVKLTKVLKGTRKGNRRKNQYGGKHDEKKYNYDIKKSGVKFKKQLRGGLKLKDVGFSKADATQDAKKLKDKGHITHIEKVKGHKVWGIYARKKK